MAVLAYQDSGKGFPVVLIHGFCENRNLWKDLEHLLVDSYRVVSIELPGFGQSAPAPDHLKLSIESMAGDVHQTLNELQIDRHVIIGHSLGGYVALAYAEFYEAHLAGLGLFHSSAMADLEEKKANRNKVIESVLNYGTEPFVRTLIPGLFSEKNRPQMQDFIEQLIEEGQNIAPQTIARTTEAMRDRRDRREVLKRLAVPVLFIVGKDDGAVPLTASLEQIHLAKDSQVHLLEGVGHMGMFEAKAQTLKAVRNFISYCQ